MHCPNCGEDIKLMDVVKLKIISLIPFELYMYLDQRKENKATKSLQKLYNPRADLTDREHYVANCIVNGDSLEKIAQNMNVTRERIRQIKAKALRKLERRA